LHIRFYTLGDSYQISGARVFDMAANPAQMIAQYREFFERNNPMQQLIFDFKNAIQNLKTMQSRRKLSKYRCLLEIERLEMLAQLMEDGNADPQGIRLDRPF
jgi:hypothetical protein